MSDNTELKRAASEAKNWGGEVGEGRWYTAECFKRPYFSIPDAEFIAACEPGAVLALIAESERLAKTADCWDRLNVNNKALSDSFRAERDQSEQDYKDVVGTIELRDIEIAKLRAEVAGLKTGYEAYEQVKAELKAENEALNSAIEDLDRARIAGFEEYDFTRLKDRRGDQKVFEITIETECGCDVEEGEYTVRITNLLGNWLGSDDFGLVSDAVAEVVADLGLPEEGYTTFIAYESGERQDVFWTKWFEIATVASVLVEPGAAMGKGEKS